MLTFEKVLEIFADYLTADETIEVYISRHGCVRVEFDQDFHYCSGEVCHDIVYGRKIHIGKPPVLWTDLAIQNIVSLKSFLELPFQIGVWNSFVVENSTL